MKTRVQLVRALLIPLLAASAAGADLDHSRWDAVLKRYVTTASRVDYQSLKERGLTDLDAYLWELARPWPGDMAPAATNAALINAYNALTVRWIVSNYPVKSIQSTDNPFGAGRHILDGKHVSLDEIEGRLRAMRDPRIHAALVCAARSCPPLSREAYVAARIDTQLDANVRRWLRDTPLNEFVPDRNIARVSAIFKWYAGDFEQAGGLREFLARFAPPGASGFLLGPNVKLEYRTYNWGLNDTSLGGAYSQLHLYWDSARNGYLFAKVKSWFLSLGTAHGVNPIVFGGIYVGAIPFFFLSVAWLIRNLRRRQSPLVPAFCASFCLVSAYLYLLIAGKNIPVWVYFFVAGMLAFGVYSTVRKIKSKLNASART